jgi:toxin secretion/phage lysis holin
MNNKDGGKGMNLFGLFSTKGGLATLFTGGIFGAVATVMTGAPFIILQILAILIILDLISGMLSAALNPDVDFKSKTLKHGILRKCFEVIVIFALILANTLVVTLGLPFNVLPFILGAFCFKEIISLVENANRAGIDLPKSVQDWLNKVSNVTNDEVNNGGGQDGNN